MAARACFVPPRALSVSRSGWHRQHVCVQARAGQRQSERDGLVELMLDGGKTTSVAHAVWRRVVKAGDLVVDATCGNGWDTIMLAQLVHSEHKAGRVLAVDVQESAVQKTSLLMDIRLTLPQKEHVELKQMCHGRMLELADAESVRLVAFNLGYLPGGDKTVVTKTETSVKALDAATKLLKKGGLISIMSYVGHPGGSEEYQGVRHYSSQLPTDCWVVSQYEWLNRPLCPRLLFVYRK